MSQPLTWTTARPTKPGFYFYRSKSGKTKIVQVEGFESLILCGKLFKTFFMDGILYDAEEIKGVWGGPIPEPIEPEAMEDADG